MATSQKNKNKQSKFLTRILSKPIQRTLEACYEVYNETCQKNGLHICQILTFDEYVERASEYLKMRNGA